MTLPLSYPDAELVMMAIHAPLGSVAAWIPPDPEPGLIVVQRMGGGPDAEDQTDYPQMRVMYYGATRQEAMTLSRDGERLVMAHKGRCVRSPGQPADGVLVDTAGIDVNGTLDQDLDPDDRRVTKNYFLGLRRQFHLADA